MYKEERLSVERERIYATLEARVGNTPLYEITHIPTQNNNRVFAKEEFRNPTGSNFDRVYPYLFREAETQGYIIPGVTPVIETTTGNAGASFAYVACELGYSDATVIIHEDAPRARIKQIESYGAKIIFSPAGQYTKGYVELLEKILAQDRKEKGGKLGENPHRLYAVTKIIPSARIPYHKLAEEATHQLKQQLGETVGFDFFVAVVGSGTFISGVGKGLKQINPSLQVIAVEPTESPALSALKEGRVLQQERMMHEIYGAIPFGLPIDKLNIDFDVIDKIEQVELREWQRYFTLLRSKEGKMVGRSSAAELAIALRLSQNVWEKNFLVTFHDPSWKYQDNYLPNAFKA